MTGCDPEAASALLRAMAHPMRLRILSRLLDGECAVSKFESELGLRQPNLSQQLAALREAGLVTTRREAKAMFYRLADGRVHVLMAALQEAMLTGAVARKAEPLAQPLRPRPTIQTPRRRDECGVFPIISAANR